MDTRRHEIVAERVHLHKRSHANCIAKVIRIHALGQAGAGHWFCSQEARLQSLSQSFADEGESKTSIIAAATYTSDHYIREVTRPLHLPKRFYSDNLLFP